VREGAHIEVSCLVCNKSIAAHEGREIQVFDRVHEWTCSDPVALQIRDCNCASKGPHPCPPDWTEEN
jgi:hypothetical protein